MTFSVRTREPSNSSHTPIRTAPTTPGTAPALPPWPASPRRRIPPRGRAAVPSSASARAAAAGPRNHRRRGRRHRGVQGCGAGRNVRRRRDRPATWPRRRAAQRRGRAQRPTTARPPRHVAAPSCGAAAVVRHGVPRALRAGPHQRAARRQVRSHGPVRLRHQGRRRHVQDVLAVRQAQHARRGLFKGMQQGHPGAVPERLRLPGAGGTAAQASCRRTARARHPPLQAQHIHTQRPQSHSGTGQRRRRGRAGSQPGGGGGGGGGLAARARRGSGCGWSAQFVPGSHPFAALVRAGGRNDGASSIVVQEGYTARVCQHAWFTGTSHAYSAGFHALRRNDDASSTKVCMARPLSTTPTPARGPATPPRRVQPRQQQQQEQRPTQPPRLPSVWYRQVLCRVGRLSGPPCSSLATRAGDALKDKPAPPAGSRAGAGQSNRPTAF